MEKKELVFGRGEYRKEIIDLIRNAEDATALRCAIEEYHGYDVADALEELTADERKKLLNAVGYDGMADVFSYLDDASEYISELAPSTAADVIEKMDAGDALDTLQELDGKARGELLNLIDGEMKEEIALLSSYPDMTFGSRMSRNFIAIERCLTVKEVMRRLIAGAADNGNISKLLVTEGDGKFYGVIDLKELIIARSTDALDELIYTAFPYVLDTEKIDDAIDELMGYSEALIPVLSEGEHKLVGVITLSDLTELIDERGSDDYAKLAALGSEESVDGGLLSSLKKRAPWLIILLFLGLAVSAAVSAFEGIVARLPMIVAFQSLILGMAGNVGTQSLAVTVRALGTDGAAAVKGVKIIFKELKVALLNGTVIGLISIATVSVIMLIGNNGAAFSVAVAGCVGAAMCFSMLISGFTGAVIPILLHRFGIDPAVASGPLITTVNDLVAVVSYYGLAWLLLFSLAA